MRKIYSLVLMTAMLFVGANAWADVKTPTVSDYASFIAAIEGPAIGQPGEYQAGDSIYITLTADVPAPAFIADRDDSKNLLSTAISYNSEIWKGQKVFLNLNGHNIESKALYTIAVYYGQLFITGSGHIQNHLQMYNSQGKKNSFSEASVILLCGTKDGHCAADRTYLYLAAESQLLCPEGKCGVYVNMNSNEKNKKSDLGTKLPSQKTTNTTHKNTTHPLGWFTVADTISRIDANLYTSCAYGVKADIYGYVSASRYGLQMSGNINAISGDDTSLPTYHVYPSATVAASSTIGATAGMYLGGYCKAIIEGTVYGGTGVYVKSGITVINNANISSTDTAYTAPKGDSGANAKGSGLVLDSNVGYAGDIQVTVSGDSKIEGNGGYGIDEKVTVVNTTDSTQVSSLVVTGGTIVGGDLGAITISDNTMKENENKKEEGETPNILVTGGNVTGETTVGEEGQGLEAIMDTTAVTTTTVVVDGKQTVVIVTDTVPAADRTKVNSIADAYSSSEEHIYVTLATNSIDTIDADLTIDKLTMTTNGVSPKIVVKPGFELNVGNIQMNATAIIEVQAGARLIVTGDQGIYAPSENNIVLYSTETSQATFLFNPAVTSNRQPGATVELYTNAKQIGANNFNWQRFTTPLHEMNSIASDWSVKHQTLSPASPYSNLRTLIYGWNLTQLKWEQVLSSNMKAFTGYQITNNSQDGGVTYSFKGNLQGNVTSDINFQAEGFNFFGNSYTAPIHIKSLFGQLPSTVDKAVYLWNVGDQCYEDVTLWRIENDPSTVAYIEIPSMQVFIFHLNEGNNAIADINYANSVWEWNTNPSNPIFAAPARANNNINKVRINIACEGQIVDRVYIYEDGNYSDEFESGADAVKYMDEGKVNMYVNENLSNIVTDNILGSLISIQTTDEISYTLSFDNVGGEVYALRDNQNNTVVMMNEGAIYNFTAQPNATLEGRFQIVSRQEMPTAVETIEETVAPKAIYTVMGQYVGETTDWNNLPAGVYVVDGVKMIK